MIRMVGGSQIKRISEEDWKRSAVRGWKTYRIKEDWRQEKIDKYKEEITGCEIIPQSA